MADFAIRFASARSAEYLVAGIPAAARAVHALLRACEDSAIPRPAAVAIVVAEGWQPTERCRSELVRLAPDVTIIIAADARPDQSVLCGERSQRPEDLTSLSDDRQWHPPEPGEEHLIAEMRTAGHQIVTATGKPTDGVVSRWLNRPISQAFTRMALRLPGFTPMHGTAVTALLGIAMAAALVLGGPAGLLWGAALFQAASIADGVDGEIARATFRTSALGASLDSLTDALTNLAFLAGLSVNLLLSGEATPAFAGFAALIIYGVGLSLLGIWSNMQDNPINFDSIKNTTIASGSIFIRILTYIMMRDFYAAASMALIFMGLSAIVLYAFLSFAAIWLSVVCFKLASMMRERTTEH